MAEGGGGGVGGGGGGGGGRGGGGAWGGGGGGWVGGGGQLREGTRSSSTRPSRHGQGPESRDLLRGGLTRERMNTIPRRIMFLG